MTHPQEERQARGPSPFSPFLSYRPGDGLGIRSARRTRLHPWFLLALQLATAPLATAAAPIPAPAAPESPAPHGGKSGPEIAEPVLDDLLRQARERSPLLAAARARREAARLRGEAVGTLPDPSATLRFDDAGFPSYTLGKDDFSILSLELQQGLSSPAKRRAARERALAEAGLEGAGVAILERQVALAVQTLFARLYAIDQEIATREAARELLDLLRETASSRYETGGRGGIGSTGQEGQEGLIRAQLESLHASEKLQELTSHRAELVADLDRQLDLPANTPIGRISRLPARLPPPRAAAFEAQVNAPALLVARSRVRAAERRLDEARLAGRPDYTAGGGVGYRGGFDPIVSLRLGVDLPLRRKTKQEVLAAAAQAEVEAARADLRGVETEVQTEVAQLQTAWEREDRLLAHVRDGLLPQTALLLDATRGSYLAGRAEFPAVIEAFQMWLESRTEVARREAERFVAGAGLAALAGPPDAADDAAGVPR